MDPNAPAELIQAGVALATVARLISLNLARQFPALLGYLVFLAGIDASLGFQYQTSIGYFWTYIVLEPVECAIVIIAVRELLALTFSDYPGIRTAGRWTMYAAVALSLSVSLILTKFFWGGGTVGRAHSHYLYNVEISKRSVVFSVAAVIVTILLFLSRYPLRLERNILVSSLCFSALLLSEAARLLVDSLLPKLRNRSVDWIESAFVVICLLAWTLLLRPKSPRIPAQIHYSSLREDHLLRQLNSLNELMTRAARR